MSELSIADILLLALAGLGTLWALIPPVAFLLGATRLHHDVREESALAEPSEADPDYAHRFQQFSELGFRPAGAIVEKGWFINATEWSYQSGVNRWLAQPDGQAFASFHRLADEPVRFGLFTVLSDGGMVRTTCPGAGLQTMEGNWLRVEVQNVEPAELLERHRKNVELFCSKRGLSVRAATLREASDADAAYDIWAVRHSGGGEHYQLVLWFFLVPAVAAIVVAGWLGYARLDWHTWAAALCVGTVVYGFLRKVVIPALFRMAAHDTTPADEEEPA
jgi:hypothetical protein